MKSCKLGFATIECRKITEENDCLPRCPELRGLTNEELIQKLVEFFEGLTPEIETIRKAQKGNQRERMALIREVENLAYFMVDKVLEKLENPRLNFESEDIKAEIIFYVNTSIDSFEEGRGANFKTHVTWRIRGAISNLLRTLLNTDIRRLNYMSLVSFQDKVETLPGDKETTIADMIGQEQDSFERIEIQELLDELPPDESLVLELLMNGHDTREIREILGSISVYKEIIKSLQIKIVEFLDE